MSGQPLPIDAQLPAILSALQRGTRLVLEAPPGAGKTTRVPLALLSAPWLRDQRIVMLEPRRVAARAAASFMAESLGQPVGETVGYRIRFESKQSAATRILVVTEGILTRMLQDDPTLDGVGALLFDEFHERHLAGDLGLALALDVQSQLREDLRLLVMSATLDGERLASWLDAERISSAGRSFPVSIEHFPANRDEALEFQLRRCVEQALTRHPGDLLLFLPGVAEIGRAERALAGRIGNAVLLPLHGELPVERQVLALRADPQGRRRIVLATNVAESSVTLPGVRVVIDSGQAREPRFDPNSGFSRLQTVAISQASAEQRAGRAGRVAEGWCYRLWPASLRLEPQRRAEIGQVELSALALELALWGSSGLRFPEPPPNGALAAAHQLLERLGALEGGRISALGRRIAALGSQPRLGAMLCAARPEELALACDLAALIEARDPLKGPRRDDLASRWQALAAFRQDRNPAEASRAALAAIDQAARQWRRRLRCDSPPPPEVPAHALGDLLAHAFPDRIARQHPREPLRYQLANGRSARLFEPSALFGEPWLVISELRSEERDGLILRAAAVDEARLREDFAERFTCDDQVRWEPAQGGIVAHREHRFDRIVLQRRPLPKPAPAACAKALLEAVRELGLGVLPWSESLQQWRERVACLREWCPQLGLAAFDDAALLAGLDDWLPPLLAGKSRLDAITEAELADALKHRLDWNLRQQIDQLAPPRLRVPSGMERALQYRHGEDPVLAVKLQELFGLADTPRIADGRVAVALHLLSPAGRPLQVTRDLKGFWERTYPEVKKEMKGRYPRHPWPDDPWSAIPTHRAKPRGR